MFLRSFFKNAEYNLPNGQGGDYIKYSIKYKTSLDPTLAYLFESFPQYLKVKLEDFLEENPCVINEIRIKANSYVCLIANGLNLKTDIYLRENEIKDIFESICKGSLYAHVETLKEGFVPLGCGIRAGVCGTAILENEQITGIKDITSINIRIPQIINNASTFVFSLLKKTNFSKSILIYSAPGVGKTSILRDLVQKLSACEPIVRYAVIDTRDEIIVNKRTRQGCDIYVSYPKGLAIELATKSMTPEIIICDEISNENEAQAILKASNSGVILVATTHASSFQEIKDKSILMPLFDGKVFDYAIGVKREKGEKHYSFTLNELKKEDLL